VMNTWAEIYRAGAFRRSGGQLAKEKIRKGPGIMPGFFGPG
jgi:hypothetical protein